MTFQDTYEMLVMIGEFDKPAGTSSKSPAVAFSAGVNNERYRMVKELIGLAVRKMRFGVGRWSIRFDMEGWTLFAYMNGSLVLYSDVWDGKTNLEQTFDNFEDVKKYLEEQV